MTFSLRFLRLHGEALQAFALHQTTVHALGRAEAENKAQMGRAQADATQAMGDAEATSIGKRMAAEAEGLTSKFDAMDKMSIESRSHEEFRMALETGDELPDRHGLRRPRRHRGEDLSRAAPEPRRDLRFGPRLRPVGEEPGRCRGREQKEERREKADFGIGAPTAP